MMMRNPTAAWGLLVLLAIAIVAVSWQVNERRERIQPAAASPERDAQTRDNAVTADLTPPGAARARHGSPQLHDAEAQRAEDKAAIDRIVEAGRNQLQGRFASERVNPGWAMGKEQALTRLSSSAQIEELSAKPKRFRADCRSTVCRVHADFANRLAAEDWLTLYALNVGPEMPNISMHRISNPDGSVRLELYGFARPATP